MIYLGTPGQIDTFLLLLDLRDEPTLPGIQPFAGPTEELELHHARVLQFDTFLEIVHTERDIMGASRFHRTPLHPHPGTCQDIYIAYHLFRGWLLSLIPITPSNRSLKNWEMKWFPGCFVPDPETIFLVLF